MLILQTEDQRLIFWRRKNTGPPDGEATGTGEGAGTTAQEVFRGNAKALTPSSSLQHPESWLPDLYHLCLIMGRIYSGKYDQPKLKDQKILMLAISHQMAEADHFIKKPKVSKSHTQIF